MAVVTALCSESFYRDFPAQESMILRDEDIPTITIIMKGRVYIKNTVQDCRTHRTEGH